MANFSEQVARDWPDESFVRDVVVRLTEKLSSMPLEEHYTFDRLLDLSNADRGSLSEALLYLANPVLKVLSVSLLYSTLEGDLLELPEAEAAHFARKEPVVDPHTGRHLSADEVYVSFVPGARLLEMVKK